MGLRAKHLGPLVFLVALTGCRRHAATPALSDAATADAPSATASASRVAPSPASRATKIALHGHLACALLEDHTVACWGRGPPSAGAYYRVRETSTPKRLAGITDAIDVAVADGVVILGEGGRLYVFGDEDPTPRSRATLEGAVAVSAYGRNLCILEKTGQVACAGQDPKSAFVDVRGLSDAVWLDVAQSRACAARRDGQVLCWDLGTRSARAAPVNKLDATLGIRVGASVVCARDRERMVRCASSAPMWAKDFGPADAFALVQDEPPPYEGWTDPLICVADASHVGCEVDPLDDKPPSTATKQAMPDAALVKGLVSSGSTTCALDGVGAVRCWGSNSDGVLGRPDARWAANVVQPMASLPRIRDIALADGMACALGEEGKVWCWGMRFAERGADMLPAGAPEEVPGLPKVVRLIANHGYACAFDSGSQATCWYRYPHEGQPYAPVRVPALDGVRAAVLPDSMGNGETALVIGPAGDLQMGGGAPNYHCAAGPDSLEELRLTPVKGFPSVRWVGVGVRDAFIQDAAGKVFTAYLDAGRFLARPAPVPSLDGALALDSWGLGLFPGGELRDKKQTVRSATPLVTLLDGNRPCGLTKEHDVWCAEPEPSLDPVIMKDVLAAASPAGIGNDLCGVDTNGSVSCVGDCREHPCQAQTGIDRSAEPLVVGLP